MIKFTNKIIIIILMIFLLPCCDNILNQQNGSIQDSLKYGRGSATMMKQIKTDTVSQEILDSLIIADELPNIEEWSEQAFRDYETNEDITKRVHIKYIDNEGRNIMYIITDLDEKYLLEERITL